MSQAQLLPTEHFSPSVSLHDGRPATTSLSIAEHFGKRHDDVLKSIRKLCAELPDAVRARNFAETSRTIAGPNNSERQERIFIVYFDGFILLVMGYTGKKALQIKLLYIAAFNAMRDELAAQREAALPEVPHIKITPSTTASRKPLEKLLKVWAAQSGIIVAQCWTMVNSAFNLQSITELPEEWIPDAIAWVQGKIDEQRKALPPCPGSNLEQSRPTPAPIWNRAADLTTIPPEIANLPDTRRLFKDIQRAADCLAPSENWTHMAVRMELDCEASRAASHAVNLHVNAAWYALGMARSSLLAAVAVGKLGR